MAKKNIILMHGALGSRMQLEPLKARLSALFNVYDLNFEGHGGNPTDNNYSMDLFAGNLLEIFKNNNLDSAHLFGYSMGGYVALNFASHHPDLVENIITLATKFDWTQETAEKEVKMLDPEKIKEKVPRFAELLRERHAPVDWEEVLRKTAWMMLDLGSGNHLDDEIFQKIKHKVLISIGDLDKMVSIEESEQVADLLPNGSLKVIEGCEHPIEKVDMKILASIITDFIEAN